MIDSEIREILQSILKLLKGQVEYQRRTHESYSALYDALKVDHPELAKNLQTSMETIRVFPETQSQLDAIDALLQRLA
jgi:predicted transcriptional regulator